VTEEEERGKGAIAAAGKVEEEAAEAVAERRQVIAEEAAVERRQVMEEEAAVERRQVMEEAAEEAVEFVWAKGHGYSLESVVTEQVGWTGP
jgi:hypothetical protein